MQSRRTVLAALAAAPFSTSFGYTFYDDFCAMFEKASKTAKGIGEDVKDKVAELQASQSAPTEKAECHAEGTPEPVASPRSTSLGSSTFQRQARAYAKYIDSLGLRYISAHEVIAPHTKRRRGVSNSIPPRHLWKNMARTLKVADEIRHRLGVPLRSINSAYRSPAYNRTCPGAARRSTHMDNLALDLVYDCSPSRVFKVAKQLRKEGLFKGGVGRYSSFTHIDTRGSNATWS